MKRKLLYLALGAMIVMCLAVEVFLLIPEQAEVPEDLTLSDYPKLFEKEVVIVIGENATKIEYESAGAIAENLYNVTGNMPALISDSELIDEDKANNNLIIVGSAGMNRVLEEVYERTDATWVTDEYPGENKGVLEILRNPWNDEKAMLLFEGSDAWGVKAAASKLEQLGSINETSVIAELDKVEDDYKISLQSRQFVPSPGIVPSTEANITSSPLERVHVFIQFYHILNVTERENLENAGVRLLTYIPNNARFASISSDSTAKLLQFSFVRWIGEILPEDKISPDIRESGVAPWATNPDGTVNLTIMFFKDVSLDDASLLITDHGGIVRGRAPIINALVVTLPNEEILTIANEDSVHWIEQRHPPALRNDGSRTAIGVNIVQAPPYNLNGEGIIVGEWDGGVVDNNHPDLGDRITHAVVAAVNNHATHVAGTLLGNGTIDWTYRGMAPNATLVSYDYWTVGDVADLNSDYEEAINTYGINISTNSWGYSDQTAYNGIMAAIDAIVRGEINRPLPIVWAIPNQGRQGWGWIGESDGAKNVISVGATNSNDDSQTEFSSLGPTPGDGRLKPDIMAAGCEHDPFGDWSDPDRSIWSTMPTAHANYPYYGMCGTSMACPAVSGSLALMLQDYRNIHDNTDPLPSTIKALLIHTAADLNNTGPDYATGYGRINVQDAVDMIRDDAACCNVIIENNISAEGEMDNYTIEVPAGTSELKVTLVWDDYPGDPVAAEALVNDLDLILRDPNGVRKYPWTLDPSNPANGAERNKPDDLNNVEQVYVSNPLQGTWNITVNGTTVPEPIQNYSLVSSVPMKEEDMTDVEWAIEKGLCWLYHNQNPDGSWSHSVGITSLGALAFLNAGYDENDPTVRKAIDHILGKVQPDGRITTGQDTYETSLATIALVATHNDSYNTIIEKAAQWLKDSQWDETCLWGSVNKDNWYYGGFGYGSSQRPDLSNSQFALMALDAVTSFSKDDLLWDKAQVFLARDQMRQVNVNIPDIGYTVVWDPAYNWNNDGGFVYLPGSSLSGAGSYGSMTAAGIWSLRLCNVPTTGPRVQAALDWHKGHYTWDQNPGMTPDGRRFQYYYYLAFSKALMMTVGQKTFDGHDWYADLSAKLTDLQHPDGHWVNTYTGHGSEGSPELCTAYSILALQVREIPTDIKRLSWMTFILHSNADLHVYDPLGRHVGKNYETGGIDLEIPNATYMSNDIQNITVPELETGNYRIVLIGTGTGEYTLDVTGGVGNDTVSEDSYTGNIKEGEIHESTVNVAMITWLTIHVEEPDPVDAMVQSATGTGNVSFISDAGTIEDLLALNESDMPEENPNVDFPHGLFRFNIMGVNSGQIVNITIACPQDIPTTAQYWLCGPNGSIDNPQPLRWYETPMNSNDGDSVITITKQDGGIGDEDGVENGIIVDDGGPGIATLPVAAQVPTLTPIGITALIGLLLVLGGRRSRKKRRN